MFRHSVIGCVVALLLLGGVAQATLLDMYVSQKGSGNVGQVFKYGYDTSTHTATLDTGFSLSGGIGAPMQMAVGADGYLYVVAQDGGKVAWYNRTTGASVGSVALANASGIILGPDSTGDGIADLYVTAWDKYLRRLSGGSLTTIATASSSYKMERLALGPDGNLYAASSGWKAVDKVNMSTLAVSEYWGGSWAVGGVAWGGDGKLYAGGWTDPSTIHQITSPTTENASWATGLVYAGGMRFGPDYNGAGGASDLFVAQYSSGGSNGKLTVFDGSTGASLGNLLTGLTNPMDVFFVTPAPEPGTLTLLATALAGLLAYAWRKRR